MSRKLSAGLRIAAALAVALAVPVVVPSVSVASQLGAADVPSPVGSIISEQLEAEPGGTVVGNEIRYADGTVFVAVPAGVLSLSQCTSGRFCGWSATSYTGSFHYTTASGALTWTAHSYSNNRSGTTVIFGPGGVSLCFTPGQDRASVSSTFYSPTWATLSTSTVC